MSIGKGVKIRQQLLEYFKDVCQKRFGDELVEFRVSFTVSHQAFVQILVKTVTSEIKTFAGDLA